MKAVLISITPKWVEKIMSGKKTIEIRHTAPKKVPFKAYIYCTKEKPFIQKIRFGDIAISHTQISNNLYNGKVIGEFICNKVYKYTYDYCDGVDIDDDMILETAINREDINIYAKGKTLYGWYISDLKIYDKPRELSEFYKPCPTKEKGDCLSCDCLADNDYGGICTNNLTRPPQSWQYVEDLGEVK